MNNVFAPMPGAYQLLVLDHSGQYADALHILVNGNRFVRMNGSAEIVWGGVSALQIGYSSTSSFTRKTGQGRDNGEIDATGRQVTAATPSALPADVARVVGTSPGVRRLGTV